MLQAGQLLRGKFKNGLEPGRAAQPPRSPPPPPRPQPRAASAGLHPAEGFTPPPPPFIPAHRRRAGVPPKRRAGPPLRAAGGDSEPPHPAPRAARGRPRRAGPPPSPAGAARFVGAAGGAGCGRAPRGPSFACRCPPPPPGGGLRQRGEGSPSPRRAPGAGPGARPGGETAPKAPPVPSRPASLPRRGSDARAEGAPPPGKPLRAQIAPAGLVGGGKAPPAPFPFSPGASVGFLLISPPLRC